MSLIGVLLLALGVESWSRSPESATPPVAGQINSKGQTEIKLPTALNMFHKYEHFMLVFKNFKQKHTAGLKYLSDNQFFKQTIFQSLEPL